MNLGPSFFDNSLNKNDEHFVVYYSETVEFYRRFWDDICQLILWIYLYKGHRYELRPPASLQPFKQKMIYEYNLIYFLKSVT